MNILIVVLIFSLLVFVHEFGHFIAAKRNGILVEEFGFGIPPKLIGIKVNETIYSINLLPIGGFVKLYGEEGVRKDASAEKKKRSFAFKKPWQKALVVFGGVIGNFILGWVLISFLFTRGVPTPTNKVIVEKVIANSPAAQAGIKDKDIITKLNNQSIKSTNNFINLTKKFSGQPITLELLRNNKTLTVTITPRAHPPQGQGPLGVIITSFIDKKYSWYQAPIFGLSEAVKITSMIISELFKTIYQFITFQKPTVEVTGPIGIAKYTTQAIKFGESAVLELIALLSLNLAVINILPFPALDGGRLIFVLYEAITKKRANERLENTLNLIGLFILITLALLISVNDIMKFNK